jgi:hypothetical protein
MKGLSMMRRLLPLVGLALLLATIFAGRVSAQNQEEPETLPTPAQSDLINGIIIYSGIAAVIAVLLGVAVSKRNFDWNDKLGPPDWSFSDSFATNATVIGALLATILAANVIPKVPTTLPATSFATIDLFFGALVVIAPVLYAALSRSEIVIDPDDPKKERRIAQKQGIVLGFLLAALGTAWGAIGQVATVFYLFREIEDAGFLPETALKIFQVALAVGAVAMLLYLVRGVKATLDIPVVQSRFIVVSQSGDALPRWGLL